MIEPENIKTEIHSDIRNRKKKYPDSVEHCVLICRSNGKQGKELYEYLKKHVRKTTTGYCRKDSVASQIRKLVEQDCIQFKGSANKMNRSIKFRSPDVAPKEKKTHPGWTTIIYTPMK